MTSFWYRPDEWYQNLIKPALNPPDWVFGPVWTFLYLTMGISAWLVWLKSFETSIRTPLILFGIQLLLNGLWTFFFFGLKNPGLTFVELLILLTAIMSNIVSFWKKNRYAGILFLPYISWVSFALYLNFMIWRLN